MDPYNKNAVSFFSDVSHLLGKCKESIPILEKFLEYEQKTSYIWALLGRAYFIIGREESNRSLLLNAISALRHQESLSSSSDVWNNLGLVAWELQDYEAARRYLNLSLKKAVENQNNIALPLYNLCGLMIDRRNFSDALPILESFIKLINDKHEQKKTLEKIRLQHIVLLEAVEQRPRAVKVAIEYLSKDSFGPEIKLNLLIRIINYYTVVSPNIKVFDQYKQEILNLVNSKDSDISNKIKTGAINNLVFAFLNFNKADEANDLINRLSDSFHKDPYATATLGMYNLKKGFLEKGVLLYEEAISILQDRKTKRRFRQRLNYELGKAYAKEGQVKKALRFFQKAVNEKNGFSFVKQEIQSLIQNTKLLEHKDK